MKLRLLTLAMYLRRGGNWDWYTCQQAVLRDGLFQRP